MIELLNMDCMDYLAGLKDNAFELAIVDPPYGIGDWQTIGDADKHNLKAQQKYGKVHWNNSIPNKEYFNELNRVSINQIIWGANYFNEFSHSGGSIVWDKRNDTNRYSDGDIASCSMQSKISFFRHKWNGFLQEDMSNKEERIHSCQKPVKLYEWLLKNYAKEGDRILDTHLGSGSSAIAAHNYEFDFVGIELDKDYYDAAVKRFEQHKAQLKIF